MFYLAPKDDIETSFTEKLSYCFEDPVSDLLSLPI